MADLYFKHMDDHLVMDRLDKRWATRRKSRLVKILMEAGCADTKVIADKLGISTNYFNNKMHRDSWSLEDLVQVAETCGYSFVLMPTKAAEKETLEPSEEVMLAYKAGYNQAKAEMLKKIKEME